MSKKSPRKNPSTNVSYREALDIALAACMNNDAMRDEDWSREPVTELLAKLYKVPARTVAKDLCKELDDRMNEMEESLGTDEEG